MTLKLCSRCGLYLSVTSFAKGAKNPDGLQRWCNECRVTRRSELACREIVTEKRCKDCGVTKPASAFHRSNIMKDGLSARCYECHKARYNVLGHEVKERKNKRRRVPEQWISHAVQSARQRAKRDGVPFDLKAEDIEWRDICPVLGIPLTPAIGEKAHGSPSLDRLRPELGYVRGNVQIISWLANRIKGPFSDPELFEMVAAYLRLIRSSQARAA